MTRRKVLEQWWQVVKAVVHEGIVGGEGWPDLAASDRSSRSVR